MAAYGEKGLSLFLRPEKTQVFFEIYQHTCIVAVHNICVLKKIVRGEKKLRGFEFFCMAPYGQKMVKLIFQAGKNSGIF